MWRAGEVIKLVYVRFCNQIHLLDLQAKGDKGGEVVRKTKQDLLMELVGIKTTNQVQHQSKQQKGQQTRRRQAIPWEPTDVGTQTRRILLRPGKGRQCDGRVITGGTRMRKHHNKRQRLRQKQWGLLLNNKRDAESVAEGGTELHPTAGLDVLCGHTRNGFAVRPRGLLTTDLNIRMKSSRQGASNGAG